MSEIFRQTYEVWNSYWGESHFWLLFLICAMYLLIFHRKKAYIRFLAAYTLIVLLIFWCPVTEGLIIRFIGNTFWRLLWLVPVFPVIAAAFTEILSRQKKNLHFLLWLGLLILTIGFTGKDYWSQEYYYTYGNRQKVPDAAALICETIKADAQEEEILVAVDNRYAPYIRVYDASLKMPYGRNAKGYRNKYAAYLYLEMSAEVPDSRRIARYAEKCGCNYLVVRIYEKRILRSFEKKGYEQIGESGVYKILKRKKGESS